MTNLDPEWIEGLDFIEQSLTPEQYEDAVNLYWDMAEEYDRGYGS